MKKIVTFVSAITVLGLALAHPVFAHVTVNPKEALPGYSVFTFRVPNEKEISTTEVRVEVPEGVEVSGVMPVPGWEYEFQREQAVKKPQGLNLVPKAFADHSEEEETGPIVAIIWHGGTIHEGEFMEFPVSAKYEGEPKTLIWKTYQTYADGSVVPWDASGDKSPAPQVEIMSESKTDTLANELAGIRAKQEEALNSPQWLPIGAFLLSVAALGLSLKKNK